MTMNIKVWEFETRADLDFDHFSPVERIQLVLTSILQLICLRHACASV